MKQQKNYMYLFYKTKFLMMSIIMGLCVITITPVEVFALAISTPQRASSASADDKPKSLASSVTKEIRKALVIGNSNYDQVPRLSNPENDATDVAAALKRLGFEVTLLKDIGRRHLETAVRTFSQGLNDQTVALFYYAGHGIQMDGRNYLIPIDARLNDTQDFSFEVVSFDAIVKQISKKNPYLSLFILDACRDNPIIEQLASTNPGRTARIYRGLARSEALAHDGTLIAFATAENQVAADGTGRNSPYTTALLKWLETPDLELTMMFRKVRETVRKNTQGLQIPWETGAVSESFYLNPRSLFSVPTRPRVRTDTIIKATETIQSSQGGGDSTEANLVWQAIQNIKSPAAKKMALEDFIKKYPDSPYKLIAEIQIQDIQLQSGQQQPGQQPGTAPGQQPVQPPGQQPGQTPDQQQPGTQPGQEPGAPGETPASEKEKEAEPVELTEPAPSPLLSEFAKKLDKETRIQVQEALAVLGYFQDVTNGNFGPQTYGAIYAYQVDRGMETTGYLNAAQLIVLFAEAAKALKDNPDVIHKAKKENAPNWYVAIAPNGTLGYVYGIKGNPEEAAHVPADDMITPFEPSNQEAMQKVQQQMQKGGIPITPDLSYDAPLPVWAVPPPPSPITEGKIVYQVVLNGCVRAAPFIYAKEVGAFSAGQWMVVCGRLPDGFWYQVQSPNNEIGYVESRYLAKPVSNTEDTGGNR